MKITPEIEEKINVLYLEIGTYAGVAKEIGCTAPTVKRHIIPGFKAKKNRDIEKFDLASYERLSVESLALLLEKEICDLIVPSEEEWAELKNLQEKEVSI